jgi:alkanesulfonate monooxygenase SsuD/methylene tetrahydromethanopterin reductase-like flavin-dependent oxidoreductase (luciferase family)
VEFGIVFFPTVGPDDRPAPQYFDECLHLAALAEELGFAHVKTVEHYFFPYGGYSPDPVTFLAAVAARTSRIRLGTSAAIPAFTHPVKLAGKLAMLDNISHGRLDVAFGRAFLPDEFAAFGIPLDESRDRFTEGVTACVRLWSEENVTFDGRFHRFGPVTLLPKVVQRPHPPVFVTSARSPESVERAGTDGYHLQTVPNVMSREVLQERLAIYRNAWAAAGHPEGAARIHFSYPTVVADDGEEAARKGRYDEERNTAAIAAAVRAWSGTTSAAYPGYEKLADLTTRATFDDRLKDDKVLAGDPDQVRAQLERIAGWYGDDVTISLGIHSGHLDVGDAERTLRLLADRVLPKLHA